MLVISAAVAATLVSSVVAALSNGAPATAEDAQQPLVETFDYPDADAIFQQRQIRLKKGDGHILLVDCRAGANQIRVESNAFDPPNHLFCFQVTGNSGYLTMEIPNAFLVYGNDYNAVASWTTDTGEVRRSTVRKNDPVPTPIGEGATGTPGVLIELRATR
ncbi:hypothetical protein ACWEFJ_24280 [Actinosynnema sp. NPDC004786]